MAKLSPEVKAQNKEARRLRKAEEAQRRKAYEAATAKALDEFHQNTTLCQEKDRAEAAADTAWAAKDREERELNAQIAALQQQIAGLTAKHQIVELNEQRRLANKAYYAAKLAVTNAVDAAFPDLTARYSLMEEPESAVSETGRGE